MFIHGKRTAPSLHKGCIIEVAAYLKGVSEGRKHIKDTILHEMIHYWLWYRKKPFGHTKEFYEKMRKTGAKRYNTVPKKPSRTYTYECPNCHIEIKAHRKLTNMACAGCSEKYNQGFFHPSFRLELQKAPPKSKVSTVRPSEEASEVLSKEEIIQQITHIREALKGSSASNTEK